MIDFLTLALITAALANGLFQLVGPSLGWNWSLVLIGAAALVHFLVHRNSSNSLLDRWSAALLAAVFLFTGLSLIPLPKAMVQFLSPERIALLRATEFVLGPAPSATTLSIVPSATLQYFLTLLGYLLVFLMIRELARRNADLRRPWLIVWPLLVVGALEGALGFYQSYAEGGQGYASGTYINRDHYSGLLELILPFAIFYALSIYQRGNSRDGSPAGPALQACLVLVFGALMLIGIIHSLSRMGFLATLASTFIGGSIAMTLRDRKVIAPVKVTLWQTWLPIAVCSIIAVIGFIFLPTDQLIGRFSDLAKTDDINADTRAVIWRESAGLVKDYPLFGSGLGTYESAYMKYKHVGPMFTIDYAHNDYLQVLVEIGIIGFLAGLVFLGRVFYGAARDTVYARSQEERYLAIACVTALIAILLHSFVDFNLYRSANAMIVAWIAGVASSDQA